MFKVFIVKKREFLEYDSSYLAVESPEGKIGIMENHSDFLASIRGNLEITHKSGRESIPFSKGIIHFVDNEAKIVIGDEDE